MPFCKEPVWCCCTCQVCMGRSTACRSCFLLSLNTRTKAFVPQTLLSTCSWCASWWKEMVVCDGERLSRERGGAGYWVLFSPLSWHLSGAQWRVPGEPHELQKLKTKSTERFCITLFWQTFMFKDFFFLSEMRSLNVLSTLVLTLGLRGVPNKMFLIHFYKYWTSSFDESYFLARKFTEQSTPKIVVFMKITLCWTK